VTFQSSAAKELNRECYYLCFTSFTLLSFYRYASLYSVEDKKIKMHA